MNAAHQGRLGRRLSRILVMLPHIIANPGVTIGELSELFDADRRDVLSDLELVWMCGLPGYSPGDLIEVHLDGEHVYVNMADYFRNPLRITPAEALALYSAGAAVATLPSMEQADALKRALKKLGRALGIDQLDGATGIEIQMESGPAAHLEALQRALVEGRRVRLEYLSASKGELTERSVDPWGLIAAVGHWYLVGFDHLSSDERMFRTDRIKRLEVTGEAAEVPADFDPESYRRGFSGHGETTVSFEISPAVARWFEDYYPAGEVTTQADGWRRVTLVAGGLKWAATLVVRLGADVRAVEPPELQEEARRTARAIAARYRAPLQGGR